MDTTDKTREQLLDEVVALRQQVSELEAQVIEHHQVKLALQDSDRRLKNTLEAVNDAIIMVDRSHTIVLFNRAAEHTFGYETDEVIGQPLEILIPEDFQESHHKHLDASVAEPDFARHAHGRQDTLSGRRRNGETFPAEISLSKLELSGEIYFTAIVRDITERKKTEELRQETIRLEKELARERELQALKSRFISMASHDLRTPLTVIQLNCQTLESYGEHFDEQQKTVRYKRIRNSIYNMMELLDDVVTLGQSEEWEIEFKPTALDLGAFCQGLEDELRIIAGTNIELIFIPPKEIDYILLADEKLLRQTITNLLSNAIKYSPDGGTVALECSHDDQHTIIRVSDEGIGIPDKDQEHLFDAFHRASNVRDLPGTGLGLTIAKQAINLHGGTIAVESEVGKGTTFTVTIPKT